VSFIAAPLFLVQRVLKPMDASIPLVPDMTLAMTKSSMKRYQHDSFDE